MRYRRLDLNLLVALEAILAERSVTRAASKLSVTQPAMSGALARLREYFEDPIVIQVGRLMELTPLAQSLVGPVHDIIMRIDSAIALEPAFDPGESKRHFSITASDYVIHVLLRDVLCRLYKEAPHVTFAFQQPSRRVQEELESGEVDFIISAEIDMLPQHPQQALFEDTYTLIAWSESKVVGDTVTFDQYMALNHVVFRSDRQGSPWLERWFEKRYGNVRNVDIATHNFAVLPYLVIGTDRVATIQTRLARQCVGILPLKMIAPPIELPKLVEVLQWNMHRDPDPASQWLRNVLKEHAAQLPPAD